MNCRTEPASVSCCFLLASFLYFPLACCSAWFVQGCNTKGDGEEEERRKFLLDSCCCCCQVASVVSDPVRPHRRQPIRLPRPWDSPGKNTGVGCRFLLLTDAVNSQLFAFSTCQCVKLVLSRALSWVLQGFLYGFLRPQLIFKGEAVFLASSFILVF